ncbi:MAG: DUF5908 family protein [Chitinophagaceae bacterium]
MPVEIRELIIKTEITSVARGHSTAVKEKDLSAMKKQLLEEFQRMINGQTKRNIYKR